MSPPASGLRLVLDTNVWLDWLVFDDPRVRPILTAAGEGQVRLFLDAPCADELMRALGYAFRGKRLAPGDRQNMFTRCRNRAQWWETGVDGVAMELPACRDPDDQKFLQLSLSCDAHALVTRDQALLDLDRRRALRPRFRVLTPLQATRMIEDARPTCGEAAINFSRCQA